MAPVWVKMWQVLGKCWRACVSAYICIMSFSHFGDTRCLVLLGRGLITHLKSWGFIPHLCKLQNPSRWHLLPERMIERWSRVKNDNETLAANAELIWGPQLDEGIMRVRRRGFRRHKKQKQKKQEHFRCQGQFCCDGAGPEALMHCTGRCAPLKLGLSRLASAEQNYFSIHPWPRKLLNALRVCVLGGGALPEMRLWAPILSFWYYPPSIKPFPLAFKFFSPETSSSRHLPTLPANPSTTTNTPFREVLPTP